MPDLTPNLNLEKPLDNETADIGVINSNMDKIDTGFGNIQQQIENIDVTGTQITVDQSQAPSLPGNGTIAQLFNWIANRIKAITGKTNWWDTPDITLASAKSHIDAAAPHSGHETPAGAQAKVDAHANATDPHPQYALDTDLNSHAALTSVHGATSTATANTIIMRDASGRAKVAAPSASDDIARKDTIDTHAGVISTISTLGHVYEAEFTATITAASWSGTTPPYSNAVTVSGITSSHNPIIDVIMSGTYSTDQQRGEQWGNIYRAVTSSNTITFYAHEKPTIDLPIRVKVVM